MVIQFTIFILSNKENIFKTGLLVSFKKYSTYWTDRINSFTKMFFISWWLNKNKN